MFRNIFLVLNNRFFACAILSEHIVTLTIMHVIKHVFMTEKNKFQKTSSFCGFFKYNQYLCINKYLLHKL